MKNLQVGQRITFKNEYGTFNRKIQSVYICSFNTDVVKYNTKGLNGGFGCDGFCVEPEQIIKINN